MTGFHHQHCWRRVAFAKAAQDDLRRAKRADSLPGASARVRVPPDARGPRARLAMPFSSERQVLYQCRDYQHSNDENDQRAEHREPHHAVVHAYTS
jgi:hypothetical protein